MWLEYTQKKYNFSYKKISLHNQSHHCNPIPFHKSRFVIFSKKISILFILVFSFLLSCSIRPELSVQEGLQKSTDKPRLVDRVTLSTIGDIIIHDAQLKSAWDTENNSYNFEPIFSPVKDLLSAADLTIANLETTLPSRKKMYAGYPRFGTPDALVAALQRAGVDILTTANNHACDTGKQGVIRTIKVLDAHGLLHVGTYRNKKAYETQRILIVERNHIRLVFLGYTYGLNGMPIPKGTYVNLTNQQQIMNDIQLARAQNPDFIIVLLHCGTEYERYPD